MKLYKSNPIRIKRHIGSGELCLVGCKYSSECPKCYKEHMYDSEEIFLAKDLGGKHICGASFHCNTCDEEWEDESTILIDINVEIGV